MNLKKTLTFIFLSVLSLWFILAIFRTFYNFSKVPNDVKLLSLSEVGKRKNTYGEFFDFCKFIESKTPQDSKIIFLSSSGKAFYVCRYETYPRQLFYIFNPKDIPDKSDYDYLIVYRSSDSAFNENKSEEWNLKHIEFDSVYEDEFGGRGGIVNL